jgi:hypothetical protein
MPADLEIRCSCGRLGGVLQGVAPRDGNRGVCYCDDCQAFAHFLGRADAILDARGGTSIFQTSPGRVVLTRGAERLAGMRLTPNGLVRWYASCCNTPIGNTPASAALPFVGLIETCLAPPESGGSHDRLLGPVRFHVWTQFAREPKPGTLTPDQRPLVVSRWPPLGAVLRFFRLVLGARLRGDGRRSPFRDPATGALRVAPRVLTPEERCAALAARTAQ